MKIIAVLVVTAFFTAHERHDPHPPSLACHDCQRELVERIKRGGRP